MTRVFRISILNLFIICMGINSFAQPINPLSLHFKKDYQVRNFYNSSVKLSKLDLAKDILNESIYPEIHLTSSAGYFSTNGQVLKTSNNSKKEQESYINLGKLYNYAAIDLDIKNQTHNSGSSTVLLSFYKDVDNRFIIAQNAADNKRITLQIVKKGKSVLNETLSEEGVKALNTLRVY